MKQEAHLSDPELRTWRAFLEAHRRATAALDHQLRDAGCSLDLREYDLMVHISEAGASGLRMRDLARRALINPSNVTRRLESLAERGLVERRPDPEDGRGVIALLTPAGKRALRRAAAVHLEGVKTLVFRGEPVDLAVVRRFLEHIAPG